ncbi:MAG: DUF72 domain-containing protein [Candidatus Hydrogenedens sp.]
MSTNLPQIKPCPCYIGVSGWAYKDWKKTVYSENQTLNIHPIRYLAQWINCIEVNVTHYQPIPAIRVQSWVEQVIDNPSFLFTVKIWKRFTHEDKRNIDIEDVKLFINSIEPIVETNKLGCLLIQFPQRFHRTPENRRYLTELTNIFTPLPLCIEFRHKSWLHIQTLESFRERGLAFCNIDQPLPDPNCLPPTEEVTADFAYIRFHGRNIKNWFSGKSNRDERYNYLYSESELEPWVESIQRMRNKAQRIFVLMNNHFAGKALINAIQLRKKLGYSVDTPLPYELQRVITEHK